MAKIGLATLVTCEHLSASGEVDQTVGPFPLCEGIDPHDDPDLWEAAAEALRRIEPDSLHGAHALVPIRK